MGLASLFLVAKRRLSRGARWCAPKFAWAGLSMGHVHAYLLYCSLFHGDYRRCLLGLLVAFVHPALRRFAVGVG